ncbi:MULTISPECIES: hypothetical protein [unclassified Beijerinckia]|uniref:hypothetical protein n=1 Tax=unclassified Beijerinckia TaxID=2638183 RepID=UPI00089590B8|nr:MULTISPECIES: hypothetical protein [unclassified Beijerinckia]MDH7799028.1 hypothetical protein [Beijerinckia sp. GAS462]SED97435.1 hypothetical protein SAMN05443249_6089 [Beijerinckia sp. 28-YEA-48]
MPFVWSQILIILCIAYNVGFALFHLCFWRLFRWPKTLMPSGELNSAVTQTLNVMLTYVFLAYAAGLLTAMLSKPETLHPLAIAGALFWLLRLVLQPWLFPSSRVSRIVTLIFALGVVLHAGVWLASYRS